MIGTLLDQRYELLSLLSNRQDRLTYLAFDTQQNAQVVVKILPFTYGTSWKGVEQFEREIDLLKHLSHPSIPQYIDDFEIDLPTFKGFAWVQPHIQALSLKEVIAKRKTFTEQELTQIATDVLEILVFLHTQNPPVIHRDIKPSNILIAGKEKNQYEKLYLIDWDTAQPFSSTVEGTVTVAGTFGYGAPEQFYGEAVPASDLYGLGMTLLYLITGVSPSQLPTHRGIIQFEANQLSSSTRRWLSTLIQPKVEQRFRTASEALTALQQDSYQPALEVSSYQKGKPSKLWLSRSNERLLIKVMPNKARVLHLFWLPLYLFGVNRLLMSSVYDIATAFLGWTGTLFDFAFLIFHLSVIAWIIQEFLLDAFGHMQLELTSTKMRLSLRWGFFKKQSSTALFHIKRIEQVLRIPIAANREGKQTTTSELQLIAINRKFPLTKSLGLLRGTKLYRMTLEEQNWIASEISDWVSIPITKKEIPALPR